MCPLADLKSRYEFIQRILWDATRLLHAGEYLRRIKLASINEEAVCFTVPNLVVTRGRDARSTLKWAPPKHKTAYASSTEDQVVTDM